MALDLRVCKRCMEDDARERTGTSAHRWDDESQRNWDAGMCLCPHVGDDHLDPTKDEPPEDCPHLFEHCLAMSLKAETCTGSRGVPTPRRGQITSDRGAQ